MNPLARAQVRPMFSRHIIEAIVAIIMLLMFAPGLLSATPTGPPPVVPAPITPPPTEPVEPPEAETVSTFTMTMGGVESTLTYHAVDDVVVRQTTLNIVNYAGAGFSSEAEAREYFEPLLPQFQGIIGLQHDIEFTSEAAIETMDIDYTIANIVEISQLMGSTFSSEITEDSKLSLQESRTLLLSQGYTEVL